MKANGITCLDNWVEGGALMLVLDCTAEEALSMDTLTIDVTTDDGDLAERYVNYVKTCASVDAQTKRVTLRCAAATGDVAQTITQVVAKRRPSRPPTRQRALPSREAPSPPSRASSRLPCR